MSAHRIQDERPADVVRLVGRGVVATTAALTLTGAGAGLALATPGHGGDDHGHGNGHEDGDPSGRSAHDSSDPADCGASGDDLMGGLLGDLGLGGSRGQNSSQGASCDTGSSDSSDSSGSSGGQGSSSSSDGSGTQQASAQRQYTPSNPDDIPPAPGETKIIDIPDRSAS